MKLSYWQRYNKLLQKFSALELYNIDHSTFVVNFEKISVDYYIELIEDTGAYLDRLLEYSDQYVVDSTAITTPLKFITDIKGKKVSEKIEYRSHAIASIPPKDNCQML